MLMPTVKEYDDSIRGSTPMAKENLHAVVGQEKTFLGNPGQRAFTNTNC
jgi:hypothetical protein